MSVSRDERQDMLAEERIGRLLFNLSLPAGVGMFVMALYNVVDTIFIGQVVGVDGITGLTIVFPVQMLVLGIGLMVGIGGASLISRSFGAGNFQKAERTLGNSVLLTIVLGILLAIVGLSASEFWVRLFGATEKIVPYARDYMDIILLGSVFHTFSVATGHFVRAEGNARVPMISMVAGALLNILLDAIFILVLKMGIRGAATATVISQIVSTLYLLSYYMFQNSSLKIHIKNFIPERNVMKEIIFVGFTSFVRFTAVSFVFIFLNRTLVVYGGELAVAAFGIVGRVMRFTLMPIISIGQGLQPILGFSYGAEKYGRALRAIKLSVIVATIFSTAAFLIIFCLATPSMCIFTRDAPLIAEGARAAKLMSMVMCLVGFQFIVSVMFQALGKVIPALLTAMSRQILFLLPLILILPEFMQLDGIWLSFPIADALSFIFTLILFILQVKKIKKMVSLAKKELV